MKLFPGQPASTRWYDCHWGLPFQGQTVYLIGQLDVREGVDHLGEDDGAEAGLWLGLKESSFLVPHSSLTCPR